MTELFQKSTVILSELQCLFGPFAFESSHPTWPTPPSFATLILILVWPQALPKTNIQSLIPFASSTSVPISFSWPPWACSEISGSGPFKKLQSRGQHQILWPSFSHIISEERIFPSPTSSLTHTKPKSTGTIIGNQGHRGPALCTKFGGIQMFQGRGESSNMRILGDRGHGSIWWAKPKMKGIRARL